MSENGPKKGRRKTKMEILQTIQEFVKQSDKVVFNRSALREPPWNIDPRTAEEFLRIIHFCQGMPKINIIQDDQRSFFVQVLLPATYVTQREASEFVKTRGLARRAGSYPDYIAKEGSLWDASIPENIPALFRCEECSKIVEFPRCDTCADSWQSIMWIDEKNEQLVCGYCKTTKAIPECPKCGHPTKLVIAVFDKRRPDQSAIHLTQKEASEVLRTRTINPEKFHAPPWRGGPSPNSDTLDALDWEPKMAGPEEYWSRSLVSAQFVCTDCQKAKDFPWHCFEPMELEDGNTLKCWRCQTTRELPKCDVCSEGMKLRLLK